MKRINCLILICFCLVVSAARADTITLKNGKSITGDIYEEDEMSVRVRVEGLPRIYMRQEIERIEKEEDAAEPKGPREVSFQKKELVIRLLKANGARDSMSRIFSQIIAEAPPEAQEELRGILRVDEVILRLVPIYDRYYTVDEVKELVTFYKSPTGHKLVESTPQILEETMKEAGDYFKEAVSLQDLP